MMDNDALATSYTNMLEGMTVAAELSEGGRIAIVGTRGYPNEDQVRQLVRTLDRSTVVVSGGAKGPDEWAVDEAKKCGLETVVIRPKWKNPNGSRNMRAGIIRNELIVLDVDRVVAFWDGESRGTFSTIKFARKHHRRLWIYYPDGSTEYDCNRDPETR